MSNKRQLFDVRVLLRPEDMPASAQGHRVIGTLNPGAAVVKGQTRLLVRVIEAYEGNMAYDEHFTRGGSLPEHIYLPRAVGGRVSWERMRLGSDVLANDRYSVIIPGLVEVIRPTVISHARLAVVHRDEERIPLSVTSVGVQGLLPERGYEEFGVEDPRITTFDPPLRMGNAEFSYCVSYVACSAVTGVATALAVSNDLESFQRVPIGRAGIVFHPPQKDVVLFPDRIRDPQTGDRHYWAIIRPGVAHRYISPSMFLVTSPDLIHWGNPVPIVTGTSEGHVGAGVPPIRTEQGWLIIYHARRCRDNSAQYEGWAALLDHTEPWRSIKRSRQPILLPIATDGDDVIPNVAFPTGAVLLDDGTLEIYLGLNDAVTAVARAPIEEVIAAITA